MLVVPKVRLVTFDTAAGIALSGDIPILAFRIRTTPSAMQIRPAVYWAALLRTRDSLSLLCISILRFQMK